jgi:predicted Zn-dependent protease
MRPLFTCQRICIAALVCLLSAGGSLAQTPLRSVNGLPRLGDTSELSMAAERRLGDQIATAIYRDPEYLDDPVLGDYVQSIWQPLLHAARARGELTEELEDRFAWEMMLIRDKSINAFALPGGYMGVHLGLIGAVDSRDELAAVMAHELTHVTQRHISRLISKQNQQAPWMIAAMILGALAVSKNPDAGSAAIVGGQALAAQNQLNFSRDMEREADRVGFGVMTDAGFDPQGVSGMFDKLLQASRFNDNGSFPYLRSHPLTTERVAEAKSRIQLQTHGAVQTSPTPFIHAMMAARARVLADPGVDRLRALTTEAQRVSPLATTALSAQDASVLYAGALAASRLRQHVVARSLVLRLKRASGQNPAMIEPIQLLALEVEVEAGNPASMVSLDWAGSRAALLLQSRAGLLSNNAAEVAGHLQSWVSSHPKDAIAWQLLARAYGQQNQTLRAIRADAESRVAVLDYPGARDRFKAAQDWMRSNRDSAVNNYIDSAIIDTRAREVAQLLREQALQDKLDH